MKVRVTLRQFLGLPLVFFGLVYCSGYAYSTSDKYTLKMIAAILFLIGSFIIWNRGGNKTRNNENGWDTKYFIFLIVGCLLSAGKGFFSSSTIGWNNFVDTLTITVIITSSYLLVSSSNSYALAHSFINFMVSVSIIAIVGFYFEGLISLFSVGEFRNVNGVVYENAIFWFKLADSKKAVGIFWECGLFSSYLLLAMSEMVISGREKKWKIIPLIWALFLAQSTAGLLLLLLVFVMCFTTLIKNKKLLWFLSLVFIVGCVVLFWNLDSIVDWLISIQPDIFSKLKDETAKTRLTRMNAPIINLINFTESPLIGNGFSDAAHLFTHFISSELVADSQTSTSTFMMSAIGILGIVYTLFPMIFIFAQKQKHILFRIAYFVLILLILNKEPHHWLAFTYCLMFLNIKRSDANKIKYQLS